MPAAKKPAEKKAEPEKKAEKPEKPEPEESAAPPVRVDNRTRRSDEDAIEGAFVDVVAGEYKGRRGAFASVLESDPKTGYPTLILVRTRDADNLLIPVKYADVRPTEYTGGR